MFRGNAQRTGYSDEKVGLPEEKPFWTHSLGCAVVSSPSIANDVLFIGDRSGTLHAIHAKDGSVKWQKKVPGWLDSSPLIHKGMVVIGSNKGKIWFFDNERGDVLQSIDAGYQLSSPAPARDGTILSGLGAPFEGIIKYDWRHQKRAWNAALSRMTYSSPAVWNNNAVLAGTDGRLNGIQTNNGKERWTLQTQGGAFVSTPAIDDKVVYFAPGNYDLNVYAVDLMDGMFFWKSNGTPEYTLSKNAKRTNLNRIRPEEFSRLLQLSPKDREKALSRLRTRKVAIPEIVMQSTDTVPPQSDDIWDFFPYGEVKTSSVAVDDIHVYTIQKELGYPRPRFTIFALDKHTGEEVWSFTELRNSQPEGFCSSPIVTSHSVFFGWGDGMMYGLNKKTGERIWSDTLDSDIISSPAISDKKLYVATISGSLYSWKMLATLAGETFKKSTFCYPNPARGDESHIQVYVEEPAQLSLVLYNLAEKPVFRFSKYLPANRKFTYDWNISSVANGVYLAMIKVKYNDGTTDKKMLKVAVLR